MVATLSPRESLSSALGGSVGARSRPQRGRSGHLDLLLA